MLKEPYTFFRQMLFAVLYRLNNNLVLYDYTLSYPLDQVTIFLLLQIYYK